MSKFKLFLNRFFTRRRLIRLAIVFLLFLLLFFFRAPILRGLGYWLIDEDELKPADAIVMLGGNSLERCNKTKVIFQKKYAQYIVTTGKNYSSDLEAIGLKLTEAEQSKAALIKLGIDSNKIFAFKEGTGTIEEAYSVLKLAKKKKWKNIIVVSAKFHTARLKKYFNRVFANSEIEIIVQGANPLNYKIDAWWQSEEGLIMVNNEYLKSFYYWWKY